ncbi:anthranilate synthase component I family protein [Tamlana sp. 2_MG-2023]|uniref:anthranilate synthase component I family protein n=1 Tax=unclassified Tamlana TaxID=2614803 RepID=UPI0026E321E2|nr:MULTISPECIES: anthranilate synthase component I family protein [unclassified Tamlana]MDO6758966.1 anthranilate synthase component I family protein [Tamlana sp. 2_MG-2023]MDO6789665.1 anthranilate synthase component I family protein [Tamlana sp. 1_MG-2023]
MRTKEIHNLEDIQQFKEKALLWSQQFDDVVWLDSNNYAQNYSSYDAVLAVDAFTSIQTDYFDGFEKLKEYQSQVNDWIFGYLTYDLKNDVEVLKSENYDGLGFPDLFFFQPKKLFLFIGNSVEIQYLNAVDDELEADIEMINTSEENIEETPFEDLKIKLRIHKDAYCEKVNTMLKHIQHGAIYEANFCQEFYAENTQINPLETYKRLNAISKPPFAAFIKMSDKFVLSASPERYLKKEGELMISEPIKGTSKRSKNPKKDEQLKIDLAKDEKERSENIMIVDLVRNDLSKTAIKGSVKVTELCKIYTFDQVHQMISTVTSKVEKNTHPVDIIKSTFPMGSMTGAPKISAMKIIENLEETKRGVYSGAIGYFNPSNDFDFNVVIRSILYNASKKYVSYSVGSAITAKSDALKEYEECLIKAKAMREVLEQKD